MVLGGTGDAMGYNNGNWEFNQDGCDIHRQVCTCRVVEKPLQQYSNYI